MTTRGTTATRNRPSPEDPTQPENLAEKFQPGRVFECNRDLEPPGISNPANQPKRGDRFHASYHPGAPAPLVLNRTGEDGRLAILRIRNPENLRIFYEALDTIASNDLPSEAVDSAAHYLPMLMGATLTLMATLPPAVVRPSGVFPDQAGGVLEFGEELSNERAILVCEPGGEGTPAVWGPHDLVRAAQAGVLAFPESTPWPAGLPVLYVSGEHGIHADTNPLYTVVGEPPVFGEISGAPAPGEWLRVNWPTGFGNCYLPRDLLPAFLVPPLQATLAAAQRASDPPELSASPKDALALLRLHPTSPMARHIAATFKPLPEKIPTTWPEWEEHITGRRRQPQPAPETL